MAIGMTKVAIIGCGTVGSTLGYYLASNLVCNELVMINRNERKAWAEAKDLQHSMGYANGKIRISNGTYSDCGDADIVVLSIGAPYRDGMTRLDMFAGAAKITEQIIPQVIESGFDGIFIIVTNPVDLITKLVWKLSGFPSSRVIGTGTALDSSRLRIFLADLMGVDYRNVSAFCMGEHGDSQFIPWSQILVGGKPLEFILNDNPWVAAKVNLSDVGKRIANVAYDIVRCKGATYYGIATTTGEIIHSILYDDNRVMPVSCMLEPPYGTDEVFIGIPAVICRKGVRETISYHLTEEEQALMARSIETLERNWESLYPQKDVVDAAMYVRKCV